MITSRELNKGNWMCHSANHLFQIGCIDRLQEYVQPLYNDNRWLDVSGLSGIPLTEEILLKCGFKKAGMSFRLNIISDWEFAIYATENFFRFQTTLSGHTIHLTHIKHLHELQNIYYWLSGKKELEVKL